MLKIGSLDLKSNLILAPLSGISDLPFRMLNREFGCELAFVEMINCRSISNKSRRTKDMLSSGPLDRPLGIQLLGRELKFILKAMDVLRSYKFDLLDFNAACPVRKVINRGEGAALLKEPKVLAKILRGIVKNSELPVSVKIRSGWDKNSINAKEVSLIAEDAGVSAVLLHGRTKAQGYSGQVDYQVIRQVKEALKIPVIASGDIFSSELIEKMFKDTDCDGVMVARGALGNPWIFKGCTKTSKTEIIKIMTKHFKSCLAFYTERIAIIRFRKFFSWYTSGFYNIRPLREKVSRAKTKEEIINIINLSKDLG